MKKNKIVGTITPATMEEIKKMPYLISFPRVTPSNNKLIRMHYRKRKVLRETFGKELMAAEDWRIPEVKQEQRRKVKIISFREKLLDKDNFYGGLKPLLDALIDRRKIYDDSPKYLELESEQRILIGQETPRTDILIYPDAACR